MKVYSTENIRNVAVTGHQGSGKSTLVEAFLHLTGATNRMGRVEDGNTVSDYDEDERERQMSINTSIVPVEVNGLKINLIDTPGFTEFQGEVQQGIRVSDAVLVVVDAVSGPEVGTEMAFQYAADFNQPVLVVINKMDRENASFQRALDMLRERFPDHKFVPIMLPIGAQADFKGVVNVLTRKAYLNEGKSASEPPAEMADAIEEGHMALIEAAAEADDEFIEKYFETGELTVEEARLGMRKAAKNADLNTVPVFVTSGQKNIGTEPVMEALGVYVDTPVNRRAGWREPEGELEFLQPPQSSDGPLAGYIFKEYSDKFGTISYFRLFSGKIKANDTVYIPNRGKEERFGQLMVMRGKEQLSVDEVVAGDIAAVAKLKEAHPGDTITSKGNQKRLLSPNYSSPVYTVAIQPRTQADGAKLGPVMHAICNADPTLHWHTDEATKQALLEGMGGTHIEVAIRKAERLGCQIDTSLPKVPYQETISRTASAEYTHKKQTGGAGQYGRVNLRVEPTDPSQEFEFASEVVGGAVSSQFIGSTEKGVREALKEGVIAGYPVVGVKAVIYDGKMHDVDSKDIAFQIAGRGAFREAFANAGPTLLEPIMKLRIVVPEDNMGDIISDMSGRRGQVLGMDTEIGRSVVTVMVPLSEVQRYANDLRSMTSGRGVFSMEFDHYARLPEHLAQPIIAAHKQASEA